MTTKRLSFPWVFGPVLADDDDKSNGTSSGIGEGVVINISLGELASSMAVKHS